MQKNNVMEATKLNSTQLHLLQLFEFCRTEDDTDDLKAVLSEYYAKRLDNMLDDLWESGELNQEKINAIKNTHLRTPYQK